MFATIHNEEQSKNLQRAAEGKASTSLKAATVNELAATSSSTLSSAATATMDAAFKFEEDELQVLVYDESANQGEDADDTSDEWNWEKRKQWILHRQRQCKARARAVILKANDGHAQRTDALVRACDEDVRRSQRELEFMGAARDRRRAFLRLRRSQNEVIQARLESIKADVRQAVAESTKARDAKLARLRLDAENTFVRDTQKIDEVALGNVLKEKTGEMLRGWHKKLNNTVERKWKAYLEKMRENRTKATAEEAAKNNPETREPFTSHDDDLIDGTTGVSWTLTIPSTDFGAQVKGVAVTQAVSGAAGTLDAALSVATTTVVVTATNAISFDSTHAITVGGHANKPVPTGVVRTPTKKKKKKKKPCCVKLVLSEEEEKHVEREAWKQAKLPSLDPPPGHKFMPPWPRAAKDAASLRLEAAEDALRAKEENARKKQYSGVVSLDPDKESTVPTAFAAGEVGDES